MKVEVGKKYRIKNRHNPIWDDLGKMDEFMGEIVTIKELRGDGYVHICEDGANYCFEKDDFEPIEEMIFEEQFELLKQAYGEFKKALEEQFEKVVEVFAKVSEKEKKYNARIVCISSHSQLFTEGKIYDVVDGVIKADNDKTFSNGGKGYKNLNGIHKILASKFIEIVED